MPTPAAVSRSPFVPRSAQPPYSHVEISSPAELDQLGLTASRALVDVEPYGSSDLGGDPCENESNKKCFSNALGYTLVVLEAL